MSDTVERIESTYGNALAIQDIQLDDYLRIGVPEHDAYRMIHGEAGDALVDLVGRMQEAKIEYHGIREDSLLGAFAALGDWYYGDEKPFVGVVDYLQQRKLHKERHDAGDDTPICDGVFALGVADFIEDYDTTADDLLEALRRRSNERGKVSLKISADVRDRQLLDVLERKKATDIQRKIGKQTVNGVRRTYALYELETR